MIEKLNKLIKNVRASSAHRWWECLGSVRAEAMAPIGEESDIAREGTAAHKVFELTLKSNKDADVYLGETINLGKGDEWLVDEDMVDHIQAGVDLVRAKRGKGKLWLESGISIATKPIPTLGTLDCAWYGKYLIEPETPTKKVKAVMEYQLHVLDLKYGQGKVTEAHDNKQLKVYALGKLRELLKTKLPVDSVHLWIYQPRVMHADGPFRHVKLETYDLLEFEADLNAKVVSVMKPNAPFKAGPWCLYCKAHGTCATAEDAALAVFRRKFNKEDRKRVGELLMIAPSVIKWAESIKALGKLMGNNGSPPEGFKMGPGRQSTRWKGGGKGETEQAKQMKDLLPKLMRATGLKEPDLISKKLLSVAKLRKKLPKEKRHKIDPFYFTTRGKDTLMPENDSRYAITANLFFDAEGDDGQAE